MICRTRSQRMETYLESYTQYLKLTFRKRKDVLPKHRFNWRYAKGAADYVFARVCVYVEWLFGFQPPDWPSWCQQLCPRVFQFYSNMIWKIPIPLIYFIISWNGKIPKLWRWTRETTPALWYELLCLPFWRLHQSLGAWAHNLRTSRPVPVGWLLAVIPSLELFGGPRAKFYIFVYLCSCLC